MTEFRYGVHWLSFVVFASKADAFNLYDVFFKHVFGDLDCLGHGGRGFKEIWHSLLEFKVYVEPCRGQREYFHFEIPGRACELIDPEVFQRLENFLAFVYENDYRYSRLDFAFDEVPFSPQDIENAIINHEIRSLAKRETMTVHKSPFEKRENGEIGTHTVEFGSRQSERMVRVYNRRGFTRLEFELKDKRANLIAKQIFTASSVADWASIVLSHLQDYIEVRADYWKEFVSGTSRAWAIVSTPKEISQEKITTWLQHQIAPALSVIHDIREDDFLRDLIRSGRFNRKKSKKYDLLLASISQQQDH
jgi:DNA relaxase NicK